MTQTIFIGIDPDSTSGQFAAFDPTNGTHTQKKFSITPDGLSACVKFITSYQTFCVGIEGSGGLATAFERAFTEAKIDYYCIPAYQNEHIRKGLLSDTKNNERDALSIAQGLQVLYNKNDLARYRGVYNESDRALRMLTRSRLTMVQNKTAVNLSMQELVSEAAPALSLFLRDDHPDIDGYDFSMPIFRLMKNVPDILKWKSMTSEELIKNMETKNTEKMRGNIENLKKVLAQISSFSPLYALAIAEKARVLIEINESIACFEKLIQSATSGNEIVSALIKRRGIGIGSAASIVAETQGKYFRSDDALAAYAGLCPLDCSTGDTKHQRKRNGYNRYLRNAFMQAARGSVGGFGEEQMKSYYRSKLKKGMVKIAAQKCVARALVRSLFRTLVPKNNNDDSSTEKIKDASRMANKKAKIA